MNGVDLRGKNVSEVCELLVSYLRSPKQLLEFCGYYANDTISTLLCAGPSGFLSIIQS